MKELIIRKLEKLKEWARAHPIAAFCLSVPIFCLYYVLLSLSRSIRLLFLRLLYRRLKFVDGNKIRNILDSQRNQSVIHVLLRIEGKCNVDVVRKAFSVYVLERTDRKGRLLYPKLRQNCYKKFGFYAWEKDEGHFNINNHIILAPSNHMGRPVQEKNIREFVTTITNKYMSHEIPQWQIVLIPLVGPQDKSNIDKYYMLIRVHHLILTEHKDLRLSDFMLATSLPKTVTESFASNFDKPLAPYSNFRPKLVQIPKLLDEIRLDICNKWNELLNSYGGSDNYVKNDRGLFNFAVVFFISYVTAMVELFKDFSTLNYKTFKYFMYLWHFLCLWRCEIKRKNLSIKCFLKSTIVSLHPSNVLESCVNVIPRVILEWLTLLRTMCYEESVSVVRYFMDPHEPCKSFSVKYVKLTLDAGVELLDLLRTLLCAPKNLYKELYENRKTKKSDLHGLQTVSLCGRKVVSWSDKITLNDVAKICQNNHITPNELYFSAISSALYTFFEAYRNIIPDNLEACTRCIEKDDVLGNASYSSDATGFITVDLPLEPHSKRNIGKIRESFNEVRETQFAVFLLYMTQKRFNFAPKLLPQALIRLLSNFLSRRFAVSVTKLVDGNSNTNPPEYGRMRWGDKVLDVIYFTPPQSNISVSLTIQRFGEHVRLSVISDAMLRPLHHKISQCWSQYINDMLQ